MNTLIERIDEYLPKLNDVIEKNQNAFVYHEKIAWAMYASQRIINDSKAEIERLETTLKNERQSNATFYAFAEKRERELIAELAKAREYVPLSKQELIDYWCQEPSITRGESLVNLQSTIIQRAKLEVKP